MRKFTSKETRFIVEHQDTLELRHIAEKLKCDWHEVYNQYDRATKTEAYRKFAERRRERSLDGSNWKKVRFTYEEENAGGEEPDDKLHNTPDTNSPKHLTDSVYYQDYREWKHSKNPFRNSTSSIRKPSDVFSERIFHREDWSGA